MEEPEIPLTTGLPSLDRVLGGVHAGDNIVWEVDAIDDYVPFVAPYYEAARALGWKLVYFRFAKHKQLLPDDGHAEIVRLHPENGFETFIAEIYTVIERAGRGAWYVFDSLSELAVDWYSDRMLGIFFRLTCPYLYKWDTVAYFALLKNYHPTFATYAIRNTAQVVLYVYRNRETIYVHPQKVWRRYSPTMYMLHVRDGEEFVPVTQSAAVTEILASVPQPWIDFTVMRVGVWPRTFLQAQEALDDARNGLRPQQEVDYYFSKLMRMCFTRDPQLLALAEKYLELDDLIRIRKRMVGTGLIGGKSAGMLLARAILKKADRRWRSRLEAHDSFYVGSDLYYSYVVDNDCWQALRTQRVQATLLDGADEARDRLRHGVFSEDVVNQFREMLDYFGQSPIIVRSSSLLEDAYGNAFSGKYESVFCTNQGTPEERLAAFCEAVRAVYASTMSAEALLYRAHRGLLGQDEQMALLVQRVSGGIWGERFFPLAAGVGYSFNPYVWNKAIDPRAGLLRLVFGLGTRAVDRCDDDYTRLVSLSAPSLRPEAGADEIRRYAQHKVDVLEMTGNAQATCQFEQIALSDPALPLDLVATRDHALERRAREQGLEVFPWVITFEKLFAETGFVADMADALATLQAAYGCPVDVEFTVNILADGNCRINIVQCRPFQVKGEAGPVARPADLERKEPVLRTAGPVIGTSRSLRVDRLLYVVPERYGALPIADRHAIARLVGDAAKLPVAGVAEPKLLLVGPGRWGTTTPSLGVPVSFAAINGVSILCELAWMGQGIQPDVSLGTHFFNDLVEADILYLAAQGTGTGDIWRDDWLLGLPNRLAELLPEAARWADTLRVVDPPDLSCYADAHEQVGILYRG